MSEAKDNLIFELEQTVQRTEAKNKQYIEKLKGDDVMGALMWSDDLFRHNAQGHVASSILAFIDMDDNLGFGELRSYVSRNIEHCISRMHPSTSETANLSEMAIARAWAEWSREIGRIDPEAF